MPKFNYGDGDHLQGLLKWDDFVERNPSRTLLDIQKWHELRKNWFEANGYSIPKENLDVRGGSKAPETTSYHDAAVRRTENG